jgi:hypothetical protein
MVTINPRNYHQLRGFSCVGVYRDETAKLYDLALRDQYYNGLIRDY